MARPRIGAAHSLGILSHVNIPAAHSELRATSIVSSARRTLRNGRLLATAALQHLVDDPALLAIQVSRRLPFGPRMAVGRTLEQIGAAVPAIGALGSVMTGRDAHAEQAVERANARSGHLMPRLAGEVAILLDRVDLISPSAPAATRARAAWSRGGMSDALNILEDAGQRDSRYARRLRSELQLLQPDFRLPVPAHALVSATAERHDDEPLRVLHLLTNSLPHTQSGYSLRSHRILTALRDQGIESVALTRTGYPVMVGIPTAHDEDIVEGIRYVRTLPARLPQTQQERLEAEVARAVDLVEEFQPHVLHATTNYQNALVAQAVSDATGLPWVFEVRGLMEKTWVASRRSPAGKAEAETSQKHAMIAAQEAALASAASSVVTLSRTMADELVSRGVDGDTITLVPNGVDDDLFEDHVDTTQARELTGLPDHAGIGPDSFLVGAVSALVDYEGFDTLLRAAAHLISADGDSTEMRDRLHVVLAGDGAARPALIELADDLGISDRVHLPGRVPRQDARRWVEALDVVIVPRRDLDVARSVTPQKPVEAMALGRPLIVSDLPALREVVSDGADAPPAALFVAPEDVPDLARAIQRAAEARVGDPPHAVRAMAMARQRTWPQLMRRYDGIYEHAMDQQRGGDGSGN